MSDRKISNEYIKAAKSTDPSHFLESYGFFVQKTGNNSLSVRTSATKSDSEVYRINIKDGTYVFCDKTGSWGGSNIDLFYEITGMDPRDKRSFPLAVSTLLGKDLSLLNSHQFDVKSHMQHQRVIQAQVPIREPLVIPPTRSEYVDSGRKYLQEVREISITSIIAAEQSGFVRYVKDGVLFCALDEQGNVRSATRRSTNPNELYQKRELKGSDKSYAGLILGDPKKVWVVEGGVDALALMDVSVRQKIPMRPTIIISGGSNTINWMDRDNIKTLLKGAEKVTIALENEKNAIVQAQTNRAHQKQADLIEKMTGIKVSFYKPRPDQGKDLADFNKWQARYKEQTHSISKG